MDDSSDPLNDHSDLPLTAKDRSGAQRSVTRLLDELAPEKAIRRAERAPVPVEQYRTPNGCVLQATDTALSVSWFADPTERGRLGELHMLIWHGIVSRRGSPAQRQGASMVREEVFHPIERSQDDCAWRGTDGTLYDNDALVAHAHALLEQEMARSTG
jgi:hypothetical protein